MRPRAPRHLPKFTPAVAAVIERGFTDGVADRVARGGFTFSDRAALLSAAERLGIERFRANLIIADQQNRTPNPSRRSHLLVPTLTAVVAVQSLIIAAAVWAWVA